MPQFAVIVPFEHANHKGRGVGHDCLEEDGDFSGFNGMIRSEPFTSLQIEASACSSLFQKKSQKKRCQESEVRCATMRKCLIEK